MYGSALATTLASCVSCTALCWMMLSQGMVRLPDLLTPPSWAAVLPMMRAGLPLAMRNVISFGESAILRLAIIAGGLFVRATTGTA